MSKWILDWAASFGTQEMVEFLCEQGADVNKGQRSSSLMYAGKIFFLNMFACLPFY